MKCILGKKIEMTQIWAEDGRVIPVTVVLAGPCAVTQVKTLEKDGYIAIQLGFATKSKFAFGGGKRITKPLAGHLKDLEPMRWLREFRVQECKDIKRGDIVDVSIFEPGDKVSVRGVSKGKGFQGVVRRHGFHGSPASHGHKDQLRMPGSIGAGGVQRVFKGMRMGGRMGGDNITAINLEIVSVDKEKNKLLIKGAIPGARNSLVEIIGR